MGKGEEDYARHHISRIDQFAIKVQNLYFRAISEAIRIGLNVKHDPKKPFKFSSYPSVRERVNEMLADLTDGVVNVIRTGTKSEWMLAEQKNDALVQRLFGDDLPKAVEKRFLARNIQALEAFQERKVDGLSLSRRVWNYTGKFRSEMEMALDVGILDGRSAAEMSRDVRHYLEEPDKLFRRVRDARGQLHLSKNAALYHPGQGVYRSSYKNAMRLTRTETNMAYRESDHERWKSMDFVVGIEIKRSNHPYDCPTCGPLAGKYPKQFKFRGWHPQCRCYAVSILASKEERDKMTEAILNDEDPSEIKSRNTVDSVPADFSLWIDKNRTRLLSAKSQPYFVRDNFGTGNPLGLKLDAERLPSYVLKTRDWAPEFDQRSKSIAKQFDAIVTPVNLKSDRRILEKAKLEYGGDATKVKDIIRNTFIATSPTQYESLVAAVQKEFSVDKLKQQTPETDSLGYSGTLMQVKENGLFAEVQVNTAQMIYAKETEAEMLIGSELFNLIKEKSGLQHGLGHGYYEEYRTLDRKTAPGKERADRLERVSRAYYAKLRSIKI